jgi:acyl transferase domain-containing protein
VREPVFFQKAIDAIFAGDSVPDVVLEIGPHQTLVSPIKQVRVGVESFDQPMVTINQPNQPINTITAQTLNASGKNAAVLPTLKKGSPCSVRFFEALGKLFELGVQVRLKSLTFERRSINQQAHSDRPGSDLARNTHTHTHTHARARARQMDLKPYYRLRGYDFLETAPTHPFINKQLMETFPIRIQDKRNGQFSNGPVAGFHRLFDGAYVTEVSIDTTMETGVGRELGLA